MSPVSDKIKGVARLTLKRDFRRLLGAGRIYRGAFLQLFSMPNRLPIHRLGVIISRRSEPLSSRRNYLRRVIREVWRLNRHRLPIPCDVVFMLRAQPDEQCYRNFMRDFLNFCHKQQPLC